LAGKSKWVAAARSIVRQFNARLNYCSGQEFEFDEYLG